VISDHGEVTERYDKQFLSSTDADHYSPGSHFSTWDIDGIRCGALIEVPRAFRTVHPLGWASGKVK
jgi:predicted amidohydrolase